MYISNVFISMYIISLILIFYGPAPFKSSNVGLGPNRMWNRSDNFWNVGQKLYTGTLESSGKSRSKRNQDNATPDDKMAFKKATDNETPDEKKAFKEATDFIIKNRDLLGAKRTKTFMKFSDTVRSSIDNLFETSVTGNMLNEIYKFRTAGRLNIRSKRSEKAMGAPSSILGVAHNIMLGLLKPIEATRQISNKQGKIGINLLKTFHIDDGVVSTILKQISKDVKVRRKRRFIGSLAALAASNPMATQLVGGLIQNVVGKTGFGGGSTNSALTPTGLSNGIMGALGGGGGGGGIGGIFKNVAGPIMGMVTGSKTSNIVSTAVGMFKNGIKSAFSGGFLSKAWNGIKSVGSKIWNGIKSIFGGGGISKKDFKKFTKLLYDKMNAVSEEIKNKIDEQTKHLDEEFEKTREHIDKGLDKLKESVLEAIKNQTEMIRHNFNMLSKQVKNGFEKVEVGLREISSQIAEIYIDQRTFNYKNEFSGEINSLMNTYKSFIKYPDDISEGENLATKCKTKDPFDIAMNLHNVILNTENFLPLLEKSSKGQFSIIQHLLTTMVSDAGNLITLVSVCQGFSSSKDSCTRKHKALVQMTELVKKLTELMRGYDKKNTNIVKLKELFKNTMKESDIAKGYVENGIAQKRKVADDLIDLLEVSYPEIFFTIIFDGGQLMESYVSEKVDTKLMKFFKTQENWTIPDFLLFWHRKEHQPTGFEWEICYDKTNNCWYNERPQCNRRNMVVDKIEITNATGLCTDSSQKECKINQGSTVPSCNDGTPCFRKCSDVLADPGKSEKQDCYNPELACINKHRSCAEICLRQPSVFFPNASEIFAINGEKCLNRDDVGKFTYIGGFQTSACVTNMNSRIISQGTDGGGSIQDVSATATSLDCNSLFRFPEAVNIIKYIIKDSAKKQIYIYKEYNFDKLVEIGQEIVAKHEMKQMGYCLLGIVRTWTPITGDNYEKPVMATNMNGVSVHFWSSDSILREYSANKTVVINSKNTIVYPHMIYIVKNCEDENEFEKIDEVPDNYTSTCQEEVNNAKKIADDMVKEHENFLKEVKEKTKANVKKQEKKKKAKLGAIIGGIFGAIVVLVAVAVGIFFFVSRKRKRAGKANAKTTAGTTLGGRSSAVKRTSSALSGSQMKLGSLAHKKNARKSSDVNRKSSDVSAKMKSRKSIGGSKQQLSKKSVGGSKQQLSRKSVGGSKQQLSRKSVGQGSKKGSFSKKQTSKEASAKNSKLQRSSNPKITKSSGSMKQQSKKLSKGKK